VYDENQSIPGDYFMAFHSSIGQIRRGNMKKIAGIIVIFLVAAAIMANAEDAPVSPFVGTWGGQWVDLTGRNKQRIVGTIKLMGDGKGGVLVESWESGGKKINLKTPPKVDQNSPNELLILWPNGNKTTLRLDGSVIRAENFPVGGVPWNGTFQKE
jgi:hypothetical protein